MPTPYFDNDYENGLHRKSSLNKLIPRNFWGNILTDKPEYLYEKWSDKYKGYIHATMEKHDKYSKTKVYTNEAYLDLINCFPNINVNILYNDIKQRLHGVYEESELDRVLQLLLCFQIDADFNIAEQTAYYGKELKTNDTLFTKGLPQGLPHCFFLANLYLLHVKIIVEKNIDCDIDYYVDDMTLFCNLNHAALIGKVKEINKKIHSELSSDILSPVKEINKFYADNGIRFELKFHEDDEKCSSIRIDKSEGSLGNMFVLSRKTSGVADNIKISLNEDSLHSTLSQVDCLIKAISKEKKLVAKLQGDEVALYRKRLDSYYKFYKLRKELIEQKLHDAPEDVKKVFPKADTLMEEGLLQQTYRVWLQYRPDNKEDINESIKNFELSKAGKDGIQLCHLYFVSDCKNFPKTLDLYEQTTKYECLYKDAKRQILIWRRDGCSLRQLLEKIRGVNLQGEYRSFVYNASPDFQRVCNIAYVCTFLSIPLSVRNCYTTTDFRPLKWFEIRLLHYLYQPRFNLIKFYDFADRVLSEADKGKFTNTSDPLIYKVLPLFLATVVGHENNDTLILSHYYVQSIWKNGSKFLHFFTLHNVEHSVELILQSFIISHTFSIYQLTTVDYFFLFMSCYFHDISLITYPDINEFHLEEDYKFKATDIRGRMIEAFKKIDSYFENQIRNPHPEESAKLLRNSPAFDFLEDSTRDLVADISESHGKDDKDIYKKVSEKEYTVDKVMSRLHLTHLKSILRLADSLDMSQDRVSPIYLDKTFLLMPEVSRFHWISHLAVNHCSLSAAYKSQMVRRVGQEKSYLSPRNLKEYITLNILFNIKLDIMSKLPCKEACKSSKVESEAYGFHIILGQGGCKRVETNECPLICKWMHEKNKYINEELLHIADMNNASNEKTFTTKVDVEYHFDKVNQSVDDYIPFIDEYLSKQAIDEVKGFDELMKELKGYITILKKYEGYFSSITRKKFSLEDYAVLKDCVDKYNHYADNGLVIIKIIFALLKDKLGEVDFLKDMVSYPQQNPNNAKTLSELLEWVSKFFDAVKQNQVKPNDRTMTL